MLIRYPGIRNGDITGIRNGDITDNRSLMPEPQNDSECSIPPGFDWLCTQHDNGPNPRAMWYRGSG
jgi:hypothetical protein